jgi:DNA-binding NarL/FixJ family response regulator
MNPPMLVLLVDDAPEISCLYRHFVDAEPDMKCVGTLPSAEGLLDTVIRTGAEIVVLDIAMPGPDPLEAARELTRLRPGVRVLAFSGYDDERTVDASREAGAAGFISKDATPEELIAAIRELASGPMLGRGSAAP